MISSVGRYLRITIENLAKKSLINSILGKTHVAPRWEEADAKGLEGYLRSKSGKRFVSALEHSLRTSFEKMAGSKSIEDIQFYSGRSRGISATLVTIQSLRPTEINQPKPEVSDELPFGRITSSDSIITE